MQRLRLLALFLVALLAAPMAASDSAYAQATSTGDTGTSGSTTDVNCLPQVRDAQLQGSQQAAQQAISAATSAISQYNPLRDRLDNCLGSVDKYFDGLFSSIDDVFASGGSGLAGIGQKLLSSIANKMAEGLVNQVCNVTQQALTALDNRVKNAICIPTFNLPNPFDFNANFNNLACSGWAAIGNPSGSPVNGIGNVVGNPVYIPRFGTSGSSSGTSLPSTPAPLQ